MKDKILFKCSGVQGDRLYSAITDMGLDNICPISTKNFFKEHHLSYDVIGSDFSSDSKFIKDVEKGISKLNINPIGIIDVDDNDQFKYGKMLADRFMLPFIPDQTRFISRSKVLQKIAFTKNNVDTSKYIIINGSADSLAPTTGPVFFESFYATSTANKLYSDFSFPVILKPITLDGSEFLFKCGSPVEVLENLKYLKNNLPDEKMDDRVFRSIAKIDGQDEIIDPKNQFIVEEFLVGDEFSCDFLWYEGKTTIIRITRKFQSDYLGYFSGFCLIDEDTFSTIGVDFKLLQNIVDKLINALGIRDSQIPLMCMTDFIVKNKKIYIIEASARPGFSVFIQLMKELYGYTSFGILRRAYLGEKLSSFSIPKQLGTAVFLWAKGSGKIKSININKLNKELTSKNIIEMKFYAKTGDTLKNTNYDHWDMIVGHILLKNATFEEGEDAVLKLKNLVEITYE